MCVLLIAGAVRVLLGQLNITNSNVSANTAHRNGGALLVGTVKELPTATSTLWVTNTEFLNNTAQANGGGRGWVDMGANCKAAMLH